MFTGIIEATGTIAALEPREGITRIVVSAPGFAERLRKGDSIAVSGTCLTALEMAPPLFFADLAAETLARTSLGFLKPGSVVNLELPTAAGTPLGGHIVQGHVDGRGELVSFDPVHADADPEQTDWWLRVRVPEETRAYMVQKGSIAIDGISLTIASLESDVLAATIIPHTFRNTTLGGYRPGARVNLECDILAKHVEKLLRKLDVKSPLSVERLRENGY